jgi:hypothetical protein
MDKKLSNTKQPLQYLPVFRGSDIFIVSLLDFRADFCYFFLNDAAMELA